MVASTVITIRLRSRRDSCGRDHTSPITTSKGEGAQRPVAPDHPSARPLGVNLAVGEAFEHLECGGLPLGVRA